MSDLPSLCGPILRAPATPGVLSMLGTVHGDPEGLARLGVFLGSFRPDMIFVELSPFGHRYRLKNGPRLLRRLDRNLVRAARMAGVPLAAARSAPRIGAVRTQFAQPYEYLTASRYARPRRIPLILMDSSAFSRDLIAAWRKLISVRNLACLLTLPPPRSARELYARAALVLGNPKDSIHATVLAPLEGDPASTWETRERFMAERIRSTLTRRRPFRPLSIGGWRHLVSGTSSLRDLLEVDPDRCALLVGPFADERLPEPPGHIPHRPRDADKNL